MSRLTAWGLNNSETTTTSTTSFKRRCKAALNGNETDCPLQLVFTFTLLFSCSKAIAISLQEHDLLRKAIWYVKINRETVINLPNMQTCLPWTFGQNVMLLNCMV
jgi:hypothetical protein